MQIELVKPEQLSDEHARAWTAIQESNPTIASPFFRLEFIQCAGTVRGDIEVAVLSKARDVIGFFLFQRGPFGFARPAGGAMSDYHGLITRHGISIDPLQVLSLCPAAQEDFSPFHHAVRSSPCVALRDGFEAYCQLKRNSGSKLIRDAGRKSRKLEREVGEIDFVLRTAEKGVFQQLIEWKRAQFRATGATDIFDFDWTLQLLQRIFDHKGHEFCPVVSPLSVNKRLVAAHFGVRSHDLLHSWCPAYDCDFRRYSPGILLLLRMLEQLPSVGITKLDLGAGECEYKSTVKTGDVEIARGSVIGSPFLRRVRRNAATLRRSLRISPLDSPVRMLGQLTRPVRSGLSLH